MIPGVDVMQLLHNKFYDMSENRANFLMKGVLLKAQFDISAGQWALVSAFRILEANMYYFA